ncbi:hypothetical protein E2C01_025925 [Portunus trituberculatus]|uniref:Uncharacterized protein n=1 Tax=Portunus trituberculatus TaxID=210409 RepID=A0A5B7EHG8_PORTR|nr:hypothetical protein [Portunus trituberculatus]
MQRAASLAITKAHADHTENHDGVRAGNFNGAERLVFVAPLLTFRTAGRLRCDKSEEVEGWEINTWYPIASVTTWRVPLSLHSRHTTALLVIPLAYPWTPFLHTFCPPAVFMDLTSLSLIHFHLHLFCRLI